MQSPAALARARLRLPQRLGSTLQPPSSPLPPPPPPPPPPPKPPVIEYEDFPEGEEDGWSAAASPPAHSIGAPDSLSGTGSCASVRFSSASTHQPAPFMSPPLPSQLERADWAEGRPSLAPSLAAPSTATGCSELQDPAARAVLEDRRLVGYGRQVASAVASASERQAGAGAEGAAAAGAAVAATPAVAAAAPHQQLPYSPSLRRRRGPEHPGSPEGADAAAAAAAAASAASAASATSAASSSPSAAPPPSTPQKPSPSSAPLPPPPALTSPLSPLGEPIPLFGVRPGPRSPPRYRPSNALNEDCFDFAIIVRAEVSQKQASALASAKAAADALAVYTRALRATSALGSTGVHRYAGAQEQAGGEAEAQAQAQAQAASPEAVGLSVYASRDGGDVDSEQSDTEAEPAAAAATATAGATAAAAPPDPTSGDTWYDDWDAENESEAEGGGQQQDDYDNEQEDAAAAAAAAASSAPPPPPPPPRSSLGQLLSSWAGRLSLSAPPTLPLAPPPAPTPSSAQKCSEILAALRSAGLVAARIRSLNRRTWLIKVHAPEWRLELEAEKLRLRMRRADGGWSRFRRALRVHFLPPYPCNAAAAPASPSLFHSSDRQALLDRILRSSWREGGADLGEASPLGPFIQHMFPLHMAARLEELRADLLAPWRPPRAQAAWDRIGEVQEAWYAAPRLVDLAAMPALGEGGEEGGKGVCSSSSEAGSKPRPPHSCCACACLLSHRPTRAALRWAARLYAVRLAYTLALALARAGRSAARCLHGLFFLPLDRIAGYFGETTAFHFAWSQFYTQWLVAPAALGVAMFLGQLAWGALDTPYSPLYTMAMALWSICALEAWKRRQAELAQRWGVDQYEEEEALRPGFVGAWKVAPDTGELTRVYSPWRRACTYSATLPATAAAAGAVVIAMILLFSARDHVLAALSRRVGLEKVWGAIAAAPALAARVANGTLPAPPALLPLDLPATLSTAWHAGVGGFLASPPQAWVAGSELPPALMAALLPTLDGAGASLLGVGGGAAAGSSSAGSSPTTSPTSSAINLAAIASYFSARGDWRWWLVMCLPPVALGLLTPLLDMAFYRAAARMTEAENHATESAARSALITKTFLFRFTVAFVSLFWYAFSVSASTTQLSVQLATFFLVGQVWGAVLTATAPACAVRWAEWRHAARVRGAEESGLTEGRRGKRLMRHAQAAAWREARLPQYDTFNAYSALLIQWGHVTFFSWAFPLAPAAALLFNLVHTRAGAYRLTLHRQRPVAHKAGGIGVWYNVLVCMALSAVLVNCAQLARATAMLDPYLPAGLSDSQKLLLVFVFEHAVLALRMVLPYAMPATSQKVLRRQARDDALLAALQAQAQAEATVAGGGGKAQLASPEAAARYR